MTTCDATRESVITRTTLPTANDEANAVRDSRLAGTFLTLMCQAASVPVNALRLGFISSATSPHRNLNSLVCRMCAGDRG